MQPLIVKHSDVPKVPYLTLPHPTPPYPTLPLLLPYTYPYPPTYPSLTFSLPYHTPTTTHTLLPSLTLPLPYPTLPHPTTPLLSYPTNPTSPLPYPNPTLLPFLPLPLPGVRHFVESHFVGTTFGGIRFLVDLTFSRVRHSVEKNARYDIPSKWSTQLFYNKPLKKLTYLNNAVISQYCLSNDTE